METSPPRAGHTRTTQGRLRGWNLTVFLPPLAVVGAVLVAADARNWWEATVLALGVVAAMVVLERWTAGDISRVVVPCLIVTAAVWPFGVLVADSHQAFYGMTIVVPFFVARLPRHRAAATVGLGAFVAAVGAAELLESPDDIPGVLLRYVLVPTAIVVVATCLMFANRRFYEIIEEAREREAELAVYRERVRFAGDLHDIQGHTLHVVKLKIALAEKLVRRDIGRVEEELREVHALVSDTIAQTKQLAYAQRRLNLSVELENAKNLFEAAGIRVRVNREAAVDERVDGLLGQVLRETTTNILRHAQATRVRITLSRSGITIENDGAPHAPLPRLGGLAALRERVGDSGGELTVEQENGRFLTAAEFSHPGAATPRPPARKDDNR
ncbi:histidine kinase [Streptomyces sp. IB2014 016-6]|uniref:sensor histidine kinase n=1 Tax=Streptomyces sp. IB2014 016-6 TaxID=2517818 RepID=UPI0011CADA9E|nr:histidine kinase [Streptomyces sp. IB2014 016-6]TXL87187.1 sensor histidine kinase [Streptomyces sp. IB2014 016-6]